MRRISLIVVLALLCPALAAGASRDAKLSLVAYSTPKEAYAALIPAFNKTAAEQGVPTLFAGDPIQIQAAGL